MRNLIPLLFVGLITLSSFGPSAKVESCNYQVLLDGRLIGTYSVNKTDINGTSNFRVETNTAAGLIRRAEHKSVMISSYEQSKLISFDLKTWVNQKLESSSGICWDGNQYVKQNGADLPQVCVKMVTYSSACLYFEEPVNMDSLFYEKYGRELELSEFGDHQYEIELPNASKERYTYQNGKLNSVEIVQSFATITLRPTS